MRREGMFTSYRYLDIYNLEEHSWSKKKQKLENKKLEQRGVWFISQETFVNCLAQSKLQNNHCLSTLSEFEG